MKKIIGFLVGTVIAVGVLYLISAILAVVVIVIAGAIKWYINYRDSKIEWTEWEIDGTMPPLVQEINGTKMFQHRTSYKRYNRFTDTWDFKTEIDPVWRPFSQAGLWDSWHLIGR